MMSGFDSYWTVSHWPLHRGRGANFYLTDVLGHRAAWRRKDSDNHHAWFTSFDRAQSMADRLNKKSE